MKYKILGEKMMGGGPKGGKIIGGPNGGRIIGGANGEGGIVGGANGG